MLEFKRLHSCNVQKSHTTLTVILLMEGILHQSIWRIAHDLQIFVHPRWCKISEPSTVYCFFLQTPGLLCDATRDANRLYSKTCKNMQKPCCDRFGFLGSMVVVSLFQGFSKQPHLRWKTGLLFVECHLRCLWFQFHESQRG